MRSRAAVVTCLLLSVSLAAGCQGERAIIVDNASTTRLRVFITAPGGVISSVSPMPGGSSAVAVETHGDYRAFALPETEWIESVNFRRDFLTRQLRDAQVRRRLSPDEIRAISDQVSELARQIERATGRPEGVAGGCSGTITDAAGSGVVTITDDPAGGFPGYVLVCS